MTRNAVIQPTTLVTTIEKARRLTGSMIELVSSEALIALFIGGDELMVFWDRSLGLLIYNKCNIVPQTYLYNQVVVFTKAS